MIFILGGNGYVGSAIARYCKRKGLDFISITRENYDEMKGSFCDIFINANGNSKRYLAERNPRMDFDMNVRATFDTLHDFHIKKYVHMSTVDVYNSLDISVLTTEEQDIDVSRMSPYELDKYLSECIVMNKAKEWIILRLGGMVGKQMTKGPVFDIINNKDIYVNTKSRYQFINTDLVSKITIDLSLSDVVNEIFNVCGSNNVEIADIYKLVGEKPPSKKLPVHIYDVTNYKISRQYKIPSSYDTVKNFLSE